MLEQLKNFFTRLTREKTPVFTDLLKDCHAAILAGDGFESSELFAARMALEAHGCTTSIVSLANGWIRSSDGKKAKVDLTVVEAESLFFDFLVLPTGDRRLEDLRRHRATTEFIKTFIWNEYPIAIGSKWESDETLAGANVTPIKNKPLMIRRFNDGKIPPVSKGDSNEFKWINQH